MKLSNKILTIYAIFSTLLILILLIGIVVTIITKKSNKVTNVDELKKEIANNLKADIEKISEAHAESISEAYREIESSLDPEERNLNSKALNDILSKAGKHPTLNTAISARKDPMICSDIFRSIIPFKQKISRNNCS